MARLYERFLRVLQNWPLHPEYPVPLRGLPEHLRKQGKIAFSARGDFTGNIQQCERRIASLEKLSKDHWSNAYPHNFESGALGVTAQNCKFALSEDYTKSLETSGISVFFQRLNFFKKGARKGEA